MIDKKCSGNCLCADCVYNPFYAVNTPRPCIGADCDICEFDCGTVFCNHHLTIEEVNRRLEGGEKNDR